MDEPILFDILGLDVGGDIGGDAEGHLQLVIGKNGQAKVINKKAGDITLIGSTGNSHLEGMGGNIQLVDNGGNLQVIQRVGNQHKLFLSKLWR